jgi:hypothetical protein
MRKQAPFCFTAPAGRRHKATARARQGSDDLTTLKPLERLQMADTNHTILDPEKMARILAALDEVNTLSECIHYTAEAYLDQQSHMSTALFSTRYLTKLLCWHLEVALRELVPGLGLGSFRDDLVALVP